MTGKALFLEKEMTGQTLFAQKNDGARTLLQKKNDGAKTFYGMNSYNSYKIYRKHPPLSVPVGY